MTHLSPTKTLAFLFCLAVWAFVGWAVLSWMDV